MQFADIEVGGAFEFGSYTLSEEELVAFARRYDPQPFHVDAAAAAASRWGGLISSGFHTCAMAMRMVVDHLLQGSKSVGSPGLEYVKWEKPVRVGDTLRMRVEVLEKTVSKSARIGSVRWRWLMINQKGEQVLDLTATSLFELRAR